MADQETHLRKQHSRIDLGCAIMQRIAGEFEKLTFKRAEFRRDRVTSAAASTVVGGLPTKRLRA